MNNLLANTIQQEIEALQAQLNAIEERATALRATIAQYKETLAAEQQTAADALVAAKNAQETALSALVAAKAAQDLLAAIPTAAEEAPLTPPIEGGSFQADEEVDDEEVEIELVYDEEGETPEVVETEETTEEEEVEIELVYSEDEEEETTVEEEDIVEDAEEENEEENEEEAPIIETPPTPQPSSTTGVTLPAIADIRKAISLGDRFLFQRELFAGNGELMNKTIDKLNTLSSLDEALAYIGKHFSWDTESQAYELFVNILRRRFAVGG